MEDVEGAVTRKKMREAVSNADILDPSTKAFCCCICDHSVLSLHKHIVTDFLVDKLISVYGDKGRVAVGLPICCTHFVDGHGKRIRSADSVRSEFALRYKGHLISKSNHLRLLLKRKRMKRLREVRKQFRILKAGPTRRSPRSSRMVQMTERERLDARLRACVPTSMSLFDSSGMPLALLEYLVLAQEQVKEVEGTQVVQEMAVPATPEPARMPQDYFSWTMLKQDERKLIAWTSFNCVDFERILGYYENALSRSSGSRRPLNLNLLSVADRVLCMLAWLGRNISFTSISAHCCVAERTLSHVFRSAIADLNSELSDRLEIPRPVFFSSSDIFLIWPGRGDDW